MEIILQTFVFFSCLMFWVVFFHKKGTLIKLKKIESSIEAKIHILEDLLDRYQKYQPTSKSVAASESATSAEPTQEKNLVISKEEVKTKTLKEITIAQDSVESVTKMLNAKDVLQSVKKIPISFAASQIKDKMMAVAQKAKSFAPSAEDKKESSDEEKVLEKSFSISAEHGEEGNVFLQKIEDMLRKTSPPPTKPAVAKTMAPVIHAKPEHDLMAEDDLVVEKFKLAPVKNEQKEKVSVPRTKPVESFEDIINLSKALEKDSKK